MTGYFSPTYFSGTYFSLGPTPITDSDTGSGFDTDSKFTRVLPEETGSGVDIDSEFTRILPEESGSGLDALAKIIRLVLGDSGLGGDAGALAAAQSQLQDTDSGVGTDQVLQLLRILAELGSGGDTGGLVSAPVLDSDSGFGLDALQQLLRIVLDSGLGDDETLTLVGGDVILDGQLFPHSITCQVVEAANIDTRGLNVGLPYREFEGHKGRVVTVTGWLDTNADLDPIEAMQDGNLHTLILPTGDVLQVRVIKVNPQFDVTTPYNIQYQVELDEGEVTDA